MIYDISKRNRVYNKAGDIVGSHRHNVYCNFDKKPLMKYQPSKDFEIIPWGYDENEEMWEDKAMRLDKFLKE